MSLKKRKEEENTSTFSDIVQDVGKNIMEGIKVFSVRIARKPEGKRGGTMDKVPEELKSEQMENKLRDEPEEEEIEEPEEEIQEPARPPHPEQLSLEIRGYKLSLQSNKLNAEQLAVVSFNLFKLYKAELTEKIGGYIG